MPGESPAIILTGDYDVDRANAEGVWKRLNKKDVIPDGATFHHDVLHVTETVVEIDGKPTKVLVGRMHLIPEEVYKAVSHQGSLSVGRRYYKDLGVDIKALKDVARAEAKAGKLAARAAKKIVPGEIPKGLQKHLGRPKRFKIIPILGTTIKIVSFVDDLQADGLGKATLGATPVLGDLMAAYDLGSEIADEIRNRAEAKHNEFRTRADAAVDKSWEDATKQTIAAYDELAPYIEVTNDPGENGPVDPEKVAEALAIYRSRMQGANLLKAERAKNFNFEATAGQVKRDLKDRLIKASQKDPARAYESPSYVPVLN